MEKEVKEEKIEKTRKRRVSIFRRRKKSDIRPFVRERKQREFKKILLHLSLCVALIFSLVGLFFLLRFIVIPKLFESKNMVILSPVDKTQQQNSDIKNLISESSLDISDIVFTDAGVSFIFHRDTKVVFSTEKDIKTQLNTLVLIDQQMADDNKRAIYIDLRYNKPIVKF